MAVSVRFPLSAPGMPRRIDLVASHLSIGLPPVVGEHTFVGGHDSATAVLRLARNGRVREAER
ncbi:MAG: hypothetical protein ABI775_10235 [Pseudonocardiales bacterium]